MPKRTCAYSTSYSPSSFIIKPPGQPLSVLGNILTGMEGYVEVVAKTKSTTYHSLDIKRLFKIQDIMLVYQHLLTINLLK